MRTLNTNTDMNIYNTNIDINTNTTKTLILRISILIAALPAPSYPGSRFAPGGCDLLSSPYVRRRV